MRRGRCVVSREAHASRLRERKCARSSDATSEHAEEETAMIVATYARRATEQYGDPLVYCPTHS